MKKIVLALGLIGAASSVHAADLARMPVKAQPVAPYYNWSGLYVGAHIGGGFSESDAVTTVTATGAFSSAGSSNNSAVIGGGQIGYNWQFSPNWVFGLEADVTGSDIRNGYLGAAGATSAAYGEKIDVFGTVRGRLGYAMNNVLIYGTGGYAWADTDVNRLQVTGVTVGATPGTNEVGSKFLSGYVVGGGMEYGFSPSWTAKLEYNYLDFDKRGVSFPISARTTTFDTEIHAVKFGINYRFGGMRY